MDRQFANTFLKFQANTLNANRVIVRSRAPLRLGLAGGGTDVSPYCDLYGGYVLNATIDLYSYCTLESRDDDTVLFQATDLDEFFTDRAGAEIEPRRELILHKAVYNRVVRDFNGGEPLPVSVTTYSDAPPGSGLGSSSTMMVSMLQAFRELLNLPLGEYDIAQLAFEIERIDVGLAGGRQDQYAATFGGFNFMEFYDNERVIVNPLRIKESIMNELESSMILYYTGRSRESENIIREQAKRIGGGERSSLEATHRVKRNAVEMKEALLKGQLAKFGECLSRSWESKKKMADSITNPQIDEVYESAMAAGAYAGKVSGAGGGGYMMFLVDPVRRVALQRKLNGFEGRVVSFHFKGTGAQAWRAE